MSQVVEKKNADGIGAAGRPFLAIESEKFCLRCVLGFLPTKRIIGVNVFVSGHFGHGLMGDFP